MLIWIVMVVLLAISAFLIFQCVLAVKNEYGDGGYESDDYGRSRRRGVPDGRESSGRRRRGDDYDDEYDESPRRRRRGDDYDDEYDESPGRRRRGDDYDDEYDESPGRRRRGDDYDDDYDESPGRRRRGDDYDDEYDESPGRRRRGEYDNGSEQVQVIRPVRRQWRILLGNLSTGERYTYQFFDTVGIGRAKDDPEFEYFLTIEGDPKMSKHHCAIVHKAGKLYLEDLGSTNGTFLNEERLADAVLLQKEDVIRVGETQIEVEKILRERD